MKCHLCLVSYHFMDSIFSFMVCSLSHHSSVPSGSLYVVFSSSRGELGSLIGPMVQKG